VVTPKKPLPISRNPEKHFLFSGKTVHPTVTRLPDFLNMYVNQYIIFIRWFGTHIAIPCFVNGPPKQKSWKRSLHPDSPKENIHVSMEYAL